jgi:hypothetical protein
LDVRVVTVKLAEAPGGICAVFGVVEMVNVGTVLLATVSDIVVVSLAPPPVPVMVIT